MAGFGKHLFLDDMDREAVFGRRACRQALTKALPMVRCRQGVQENRGSNRVCRPMPLPAQATARGPTLPATAANVQGQAGESG